VHTYSLLFIANLAPMLLNMVSAQAAEIYHEREIRELVNAEYQSASRLPMRRECAPAQEKPLSFDDRVRRMLCRHGPLVGTNIVFNLVISRSNIAYHDASSAYRLSIEVPRDLVKDRAVIPLTAARVMYSECNSIWSAQSGCNYSDRAAGVLYVRKDDPGIILWLDLTLPLAEVRPASWGNLSHKQNQPRHMRVFSRRVFLPSNGQTP
jgi:hypothetical protein